MLNMNKHPSSCSVRKKGREGKGGKREKTPINPKKKP
jgi:hypothetical protein